LHKGEIVLKKIGKKKGQLKHATQMNSIRVQLLKKLYCAETFGFITKEHRYLLDLPKEHYCDAYYAMVPNFSGDEDILKHIEEICPQFVDDFKEWQSNGFKIQKGEIYDVVSGVGDYGIVEVKYSKIGLKIADALEVWED
jgi:cold shock CspA family protein